MEYYSNYIDISLLKNHISDDPIIDWFQISNIKSLVFNNDKNDYFKKYIINETICYKNNFFSQLKNKILLKHPHNKIYQNIGVDKTIHLIKNNYPILLLPHLLNNKYNISVSCDIMIKKHLFLEVFCDIKNIDLNSIGDNDYLIINIVPETVSFKSDYKTIQKNDIINYNECCLYTFNSALKELTIRYNYGFIFAKGYKFKNELLEKKENIGLVQFNDTIRWKVIHAREWIQRLKKMNYSNFDTTPPCIELYPNMNNKMTDFEQEKKKIAEKIKEITLIWRISYNDRCELVKNGVKTWDDIYLMKNLYELKDNDTKKIQEKIIHMNIQNEIIIQPRIQISYDFKEILKPSINEYVLDLESLIHLDEKTNYFDSNISEDKAHVCIIGSIHLQNNIFKSFQDFTINNLSIIEEKNIVYNWIQTLKLCENNYVKIYHWGNAEKIYLLNLKKKYTDIDFPKIILIDLLHFFRSEPIIIKDCFNFGLKSIGKALYKHNLIKTTWTDTDNGLDAMIRFKDIAEKNKDKNIPLKRYSEIKEIIYYNQIDCVVLMEILQFLREKYL